jgi:hypothetical protein
MSYEKKDWMWWLKSSKQPASNKQQDGERVEPRPGSEANSKYMHRSPPGGRTLHSVIIVLMA